MGTLATAQYIVDRACDELGIERTELLTGLVSQIGMQSMSLLSSLGEDLVRIHDWQFLEKTATLQGDGLRNLFPLPADFGRVVNQTAWSTSNRMPMKGPISQRQWGWLQFGIISVGVYYRYRILADKFEVFPIPPEGEQIKFYYISKNWVIAGDSTGYVDSITTNADKPLFDRSLMIKGLKARLWAQKGFDTSVLAREYNDSLMAIKAQDQGAPDIKLSGSDGVFLIDSARNIQEGNW